MSAKRPLLAIIVAALVALIGALSPLAADSTGPCAPPGCPHVSPVIDIQVDHKGNYAPDVVFNPIHGEWFVVWHTKQGATVSDIWAARLDPDGQVIQTLNVATSLGVKRWGPVVAFSPAQEQYLVVYAHQTGSADSDVYATRVNWDGAWVSAEIPLRVTPDSQHYPEVAYNVEDDEYLVAYTNVRQGGSDDVDALRVRAHDGQLMSWSNVHTGPDGDRHNVAVAYNPHRNEYLIVYEFDRISPTGPPQIRGKLAVTSLFELYKAPELELCCDPSSSILVSQPSVATGPADYLVTFVSGSGPAPPLYARRIAHTGEPLGPNTGFLLSPESPMSWDRVDLAFAGDGYLTAWSAAPASAPADYGIYGARVLAGHDWAEGEFVIEGEAFSQYHARVACAPHGQCLVVYEDTAPDGNSIRIRGRFVNPCPRVILPLVAGSR